MICEPCNGSGVIVRGMLDWDVCEACGGELRKVFSAAGLIFKGSGWHIKDYSSGSSGSSSSASSSSASTSSSSSSASDTSSSTSSSTPSTSTGGASGTD